MPPGLREELDLTCWDVTDVLGVHERLSEVTESIHKLDLVKGSFQTR